MERIAVDRRLDHESPMLLREELRNHAGVVLAIGLVMVALGIFALGHVWIATMASVAFLGGLLCAAGVAQLGLSFLARKASWFFLYLLAGVVTVVAGVVTITQPQIAAATLTAVLATYLFIDGLYRMFAATALRPPSWGWIVANGAVEVGLGFMLWNQWPLSGAYAIGIFVGVDLIAIGATYAMMAMGVRRALKRVEVPVTSR